jgi:V-type H+-transporting ATPase subunit H
MAQPSSAGDSVVIRKIAVCSTLESPSSMTACGMSVQSVQVVQQAQKMVAARLTQRKGSKGAWSAFAATSGAELVGGLIDAALKCTANPRAFLTVAEEFLADDPPSRAPLFVFDGTMRLAPFMRYLESDDAYASGRAAMVCAYLVGAAPRGVLGEGTDADVHQQFVAFLSWVVERLGRAAVSGDPEGAVALDACSVLLGNAAVREHFCSHPRAASLLVALVSEKTAPERLYKAVFALYALSFDTHADELFGEQAVAAKIARIALSSSQDKVVRVGLAALRNLLGRTSGEDDCHDFNEQMIDGEILKLLGELSVRPWTHEWDREDVEEDVKVLGEELQKNLRVMSSFERYRAELGTGQLLKGPVHSEKFWNENAHRFEAKEFKLIKMLVALLDAAESTPETLALACYDIGEFARFYEAGKVVLRTLGGKDKVMALMTHADKTVAKQALQASAKLLISNWEHVGA